MRRRLETAGFEIAAVLGDYHGGPVGHAVGRLDDPGPEEVTAM